MFHSKYIYIWQCLNVLQLGNPNGFESVHSSSRPRTSKIPHFEKKQPYYGIFLRQDSCWFPFISLTINEIHEHIFPTTNQERRDRTTGPWTCCAHFVWTSPKFIKFGHQNQNDAQKEQTFSDEVGEFQNSWCELSSLLLLTPPFFSRPSEHVARVA